MSMLPFASIFWLLLCPLSESATAGPKCLSGQASFDTVWNGNDGSGTSGFEQMECDADQQCFKVHCRSELNRMQWHYDEGSETWIPVQTTYWQHIVHKGCGLPGNLSVCSVCAPSGKQTVSCGHCGEQDLCNGAAGATSLLGSCVMLLWMGIGALLLAMAMEGVQ